MPGPHVDQAYNNAIAKLDDNTNPKSIGGDVFKEIERDNTLTPQEKQEVHQRLGKTCMERELAVANNQPTTFLRLASPHTNFVTAYMNEYTKDYKEAVLQTIAQESEKVKIPKDPGLKVQFPVLGNPQDPGSKEKPGTLVALENEATKLGGAMIKAHDDNLDKLSPEAREFLKVTMEPVVALNNDQMTSRAMSSTVMLKVTGPEILSMGQKMGGGQDQMKDLGEQQMKANMIVQASKVMMTYANNVEKPPGTKLGTKAQDKMAEKLLTSQNLDRTNNGYSALAQGGNALDNHLAQQKLQPFNDRIQALKDEQTRLSQNPTFGDKFKAFFQHGFKGVQGEIEKVQGKIDITEMAKKSVASGKSLDDLRDKLDTLKMDRADLQQTMDLAKNVVVMRRLDESLGKMSKVSDDQVNKAIGEHQQAKQERDDLSAKIKDKEKTLKVREKLSPEEVSHGHGHNQQQGTGAKIHGPH
jgi:hypothetical protein